MCCINWNLYWLTNKKVILYNKAFDSKWRVQLNTPSNSKKIKLLALFKKLSWAISVSQMFITYVLPSVLVINIPTTVPLIVRIQVYHHIIVPLLLKIPLSCNTYKNQELIIYFDNQGTQLSSFIVTKSEFIWCLNWSLYLLINQKLYLSWKPSVHFNIGF